MISTTMIAASALTLNTLFIPLFGWIWSRENKIVKLETEVEMLKQESKDNKDLLEKKFTLLTNSILSVAEKLDELKTDIHKIELNAVRKNQ